MRTWLGIGVIWVSACARTVDKSGAESVEDSGREAMDATTTDNGEAGPGTELDSGETEPVPEAFVPEAGRYTTAEFRLKEDSCGIDAFASVSSLMPSSYGLTADTEAEQFVLSSAEQGTETICAAGPLDADTGFAQFTCDAFREGYRSPYGDGFDMEVSFAGEITEDHVVAGGLTVVLHCMVGGYCDEFARSGVAFPCTVGGDLILEPAGRD